MPSCGRRPSRILRWMRRRRDSWSIVASRVAAAANARQIHQGLDARRRQPVRPGAGGGSVAQERRPVRRLGRKVGAEGLPVLIAIGARVWPTGNPDIVQVSRDRLGIHFAETVAAASRQAPQKQPGGRLPTCGIGTSRIRMRAVCATVIGPSTGLPQTRLAPDPLASGF